MVDMQVSLALPSSQAWRMKLTCSRGYKICSLHTRSQCSKCHNTARGKIKHDLKHVGLVNASINVMTGHEAHFEQSMVCMEYCVLKRADQRLHKVVAGSVCSSLGARRHLPEHVCAGGWVSVQVSI